jgi:hypothetical protein
MPSCLGGHDGYGFGEGLTSTCLRHVIVIFDINWQAVF